MFQIFKKALFANLLLLSFPSFSQSLDISLFDFDSDSQSAILMPRTAQAAPQQPETTPSVPSPAPSQNYSPNLGRNEEPKKDLTVLFTPFPDVTIDLPDETKEKPQISPVPSNNRLEKITFPGLAGINIPISNEKPSALSTLHDVTDFDIAGFYLGMTPQAAAQLAIQKGYKAVKIKKSLSIFQTTYYDTLCRQSGIYQPEKVRACIRQKAKNENNSYISEMILQRKSSRESFHLFFSSPATGNEAYSIVYHNKGDNSLNFTRTNVAKKLARRDAFLKAIVDTFGNPDDSKNLIWGSTATSFMHVTMTGTAYDATITLFDRELYTEDFDAANNWNEEHPILHHFDFAE